MLPGKFSSSNPELGTASTVPHDELPAYGRFASWKMMWVIFSRLVTLPETSSSPLKIDLPKKGNSSSDHGFSGAMLVSGRVMGNLLVVDSKTLCNWI